ncbi:MAG: hypothetical protein KF721_09540 [Ignavibacteriaceae bacterium]|nr:hypothetical protein [Ignavibacteriaceae bacterium]
MSPNSDATVYSSIFALYIFDLFKETDNWSSEEKDEWAEYLNSFQDAITGLYIPKGFGGEMVSKEVFQLTSFALSALNLLGRKSKFELEFFKYWQTRDAVIDYLEKMGCWVGKPSSGNMAMFLGIFMTIAYEESKDEKYLDLLNCWFEEHEKHQNPNTGFWEKEPIKNHYFGYQNGFHQLEIFSYWKREVKYYDKIVDRVLMLSNSDGTFWSYPGGGACYDYDAVKLLVDCGINKNYKNESIKPLFEKVLDHVFSVQNADGGFCENKFLPKQIKWLINLKTLEFLCFKNPNQNFFLKFRSIVSISRRKFWKNKTHWVSNSVPWDESDLWSTWFRMLTILEVTETLQFYRKENHFRFLRTIGLGWRSHNT